MTSLTWSSSFSFGLGTKPVPPLDAFPFPIVHLQPVIKAYRQTTWQDLSSSADAFNRVQYDAYYLLSGSSMSAICAWVVFSTTAGLWLVTSISGHRLLHRFCCRFPEIAAREILYAFDRGFAHPETAVFFYRRRAVEAMRDDPSLAQQRQRFVVLSILSALFPLVGFLAIGTVMFLEARK
jgi:hypothetical protein